MLFLHALHVVRCLGLAEINGGGEVDGLVEDVRQAHDVLSIAGMSMGGDASLVELTIVPIASAMEAPHPLRLKSTRISVPEEKYLSCARKSLTHL